MKILVRKECSIGNAYVQVHMCIYVCIYCKILTKKLFHIDNRCHRQKEGERGQARPVKSSSLQKIIGTETLERSQTLIVHIFVKKFISFYAVPE